MRESIAYVLDVSLTVYILDANKIHAISENKIYLSGHASVLTCHKILLQAVNRCENMKGKYVL